ncbi:MAG: glutamine-hydrolyzing carbamoyl-phosphate synthase small subunit [Thermoplasmataceae archaeon]
MEFQSDVPFYFSLRGISMKRILLLEDGTYVEGRSFGSQAVSYGEVVFTTSMTGYLESITDPSYRGQILIFASPTIGNYPMGLGTMESGECQVAGVVTRDGHAVLGAGDHWQEFDQFLRDNNVPGIDLVDTRMIVRKIRSKGAMRGWITDSTGEVNFPDPMDKDLVGMVSRKAPEELHGSGRRKVLFIDVGTKNSLIKEMRRIASLRVVPYNANFMDEVRGCDAVFISNGPGDPSHRSLDGVRKFIREIAGELPLFGVCLGHQLIALGLGGSTTKMKFGHRGSNHAVTDGRKTMITTHNHGYAVVGSSLAETGLKVKQWDVNDGTVEKLQHESLPILSVQYHPEASPGPHDARVFFTEMESIMEDF